MRTFSKLALATGGALLLTLAFVPMAQARGGASISSGSEAAVEPNKSTIQTTEDHSAEDSSHRNSNADGASSHRTQTARTGSESGSESGHVVAAPTPDNKAANLKKDEQAKLDEKKQLSCEKRQEFINQTMGRLNERVTKQLELFNNATTRVQNYVTTKNLTVPNYDTLLSNVAAKRAAAQASLVALQTAKAAFKCDANNPKAAVVAYQAALRNTNKALQDYRDSVKQLIRAVKAVSANPTGTKSKTGDKQ
jgi:hypothetical protein